MAFMFSRAVSDKTVFGKTFYSKGSATPSGEILFINQSCDCDHQLLHVGYQLLYDMRSILKWSQTSVKPKPVKQCLRCSRGTEMVLEGWKVMHTMHWIVFMRGWNFISKSRFRVCVHVLIIRDSDSLSASAVAVIGWITLSDLIV